MDSIKRQSAFPDPMRSAEQSYSNQTPWQLDSGMTLLDYFANSAMQGLLSSCHGSTAEEAMAMKSKKLADLSYTIAISMLKEKEKYEK